MFKVLLAEDDSELRRLYAKVLVKNGYEVIEACDGEQALSLLESRGADIIITDIMMPKIAGYEFITQLRNEGYTMPILIITAKDKFTDLQLGFMSGTDDYMVKPININEMVIRVQALLRRAQMVASRKYTIGDTVLEYDSFSVICNGKTLILPPKEFQLLFKLVSNIGKAFTKLQLIDEVWGAYSDTDPHTLEVHINRIREKLVDNSDINIHTIRGLGYCAEKKR